MSRSESEKSDDPIVSQVEVPIMADFVFNKEENKLGNGAYGMVYRANHTKTRNPYAIKEISKQFVLKYDKLKAVFRERDLLQKAN